MVSLFAGIGGFELAFRQIGVKTTLMCEIDKIAKHVLHSNMPNVPIVDDICELKSIPKGTDILCAGFPCQDLSSVGIKQGMAGTRSSLVREVFRLLQGNRVEWIIFENVSFMLSLNGGEAIRTITDELEELGYNWAYRTIDSISFVPQHRCRVYVVASLHHDPRNVLLSGESDIEYGKIDYDRFDHPLGFYWTEGRHALGLVEDGIPTLKAGSTIGIPSPPAIVFPNGEVSSPDIRDAERLQGFPPNWTQPAEELSKPSSRWKLVGNAVTVDTVAWIANKIIAPQLYDETKNKALKVKKSWPKSAWGVDGIRMEYQASIYPPFENRISLKDFLMFPRKPLSLKAIKGFDKRLTEGGMHSPSFFQRAIKQHVELMSNNYE